MPSHRERVVAALHHEETDRVPIDFGAGPATMIHPEAYEKLLDHLGFDREPLVDGPQGEGQVVVPSERVLSRFDVDVRGIRVPEPHTMVGPNGFIDEWGVRWAKAHATAPFIVAEGPLQHLAEPTEDDLDRIPWPITDDLRRLTGLRERAESLRSLDFAVVLDLPNASFAQAQRIRGFVEFLEDLLVNPTFAAALLERVTDSLCGMASVVMNEVAGGIDGVSFLDDLGTQTGPMLSLDLYRRMLRSHHARFIQTLRSHTRATVIMHSDGAIRDFLGDLVDIGVEAINPVQVSAAGMEPAELKRQFGRNLAFWGGIDTHHVLPTGSPGEVEATVDALAEGGREFATSWPRYHPQMWWPCSTRHPGTLGKLPGCPGPPLPGLR